MGYITKTVDVDIDYDVDDFSDDELIDELEDRGYRVYQRGSKNQQSLLEALEADGYEIRKPGTSRSEIEDTLNKLYDLYKDKNMSRLFDKELKKTFRQYLNVNVY
jgi:N-acetyl-anhydromuramyl-L-alanine amidase AmpD